MYVIVHLSIGHLPAVLCIQPLKGDRVDSSTLRHFWQVGRDIPLLPGCGAFNCYCQSY